MHNFIHYLQSKNLAIVTQKTYIKHINLFLSWFNIEPINCTKKDVLKYLEHLQNSKNQQNSTRNNALIAIQHYFNYLIDTAQIANNPTTLIKIINTKKRHLQNIFTPDELTTLLDNYYHIFIRNFDPNTLPKNMQQKCLLARHRNFIILSLFVHQGISTAELDNLLINHIDYQKATIAIIGKKNHKRILPLHATQIGTFINYINNILPQFGDAQHKLIPSTTKVLERFAQNLKTIDKKFTAFYQIRTSIITHWIKLYGLRKAQYLAGHTSITTTQNYTPNNIDQLKDDINKFNPF